nr:hypothetical protein [Tanacetum cinerariifolium]
THISQLSGLGADERTGSKLGVLDVPTDESQEELSWNSTNDEGDDNEEKDEDNDEEDEEEEEDELYRDVKINQGRGLQASLKVKDSHVTLTLVNSDGQQQSSSMSSQFVTSLLNPTLDVGMESIFETTSQLDVSTPTFVAPLPITTPTMTSSTIATTITTTQAPILPTTTNQFAGAVSAIPGIVQHYMDQRMNEAVKVAIQIQSDWLRDEAQRENDEFLRTIDENIKKIIKEQVKEQVKVQVSKILSRIKQAVNEQLEAKVLTRTSYSSRTSYAVAADLSEMELKRIFFKKMEGNKSIQCSDEQRNLYKALVDAYESNKLILDTYGETVTLKDDEMMMLIRMKNPSLDQTGGQSDAEKERSLKEPMQTTSQLEEPSHPKFDKGADDQPIVQSSLHPVWFPAQQKPPTPDHDWNKTMPAVYGGIQPWISELAKQANSLSSFKELKDTPLDFSNFLMNRLRVDTLTPELLAGPTYEL